MQQILYRGEAIDSSHLGLTPPVCELKKSGPLQHGGERGEDDELMGWRGESILSLGESPVLCFFISSGKNATSVQKQPKTFYEWDPLNYNISKFPKAVNRISCIVQEVLNTYIQTHNLFISESCRPEQTTRPAILLSLLSLENTFWLL